MKNGGRTGGIASPRRPKWRGEDARLTMKRSDMNRQTKGRTRCFVYSFTKRRMCVNRRFNFFECGFEVHREAQFGNKLRCFGSDYMCPHDFAIGFPDDKLDITFLFPHRQSLSICGKWE